MNKIHPLVACFIFLAPLGLAQPAHLLGRTHPDQLEEFSDSIVDYLQQKSPQCYTVELACEYGFTEACRTISGFYKGGLLTSFKGELFAICAPPELDYFTHAILKITDVPRGEFHPCDLTDVYTAKLPMDELPLNSTLYTVTQFRPCESKLR